MSSKGVCDSRCAAFLTGMIQKEESTRIRWFLKNQRELLAHLEKAKKPRLPPMRESETQPSVDIVQLNCRPNWRPSEPDGSVNINIMKPIDPKVKSILYEDVPSFIATENYLHERTKTIPENRYYYPNCASWVYGWRVRDIPPAARSQVGRKYVMIRQFYHPRISSLQRDPEWYCPLKPTTFVCNETI